MRYQLPKVVGEWVFHPQPIQDLGRYCSKQGKNLGMEFRVEYNVLLDGHYGTKVTRLK